MISPEELNSHKYPTTPEIDSNLAILLERINKVRMIWGKPMIVTSGLRSEVQQQGLIAQGKSKATKSNHLIGAAVDIQDLDGSLAKWTHDNQSLMEQIGLWMEDTNSTHGWVHYQIYPPKSGNRFFIP